MDKDKFGDFEEIISEEQSESQEGQEIPVRIRLPRQKEFIGKVVQRLGGNRMEIKSTDGKTRNCRVPGRFKRRFWLRPGDMVIITPWPDNDGKGDIIYQYNKSVSYQLKKRGLLRNLDEGF